MEAALNSFGEKLLDEEPTKQIRLHQLPFFSFEFRERMENKADPQWGAQSGHRRFLHNAIHV